MNEQQSPEQFYKQAINLFDNQLQNLYKKRRHFVWQRFLVFMAICTLVYVCWNYGAEITIAIIIFGSAAFLFLVSKDVDNKNNIRNLETLLSINKDELQYLAQNFTDKYNGQSFEPAHHVYAKDLDVFGNSSLFQFINRCNAEQGMQLFAERLLSPLAKDKIAEQQNAIKAIRNNINWWQQFQAYGRINRATINTELRINKWIETEDKLYVDDVWKIVLYIYPLITSTVLLLYLFDILPTNYFSLLVFIFFILSSAISRKLKNVYNLLSKLVPEISTLYNQLSWFEKEKFDDAFLYGLQHASGKEKSASSNIKELKNILGRFDLRLNVFAFFIVNTFFLWDLWQITALNKWKKINKQSATNWFATIAQVEAAGSFATLSFNNPDWCFPQVGDDHFTLSGTGIGHPLIAKKNTVVNDFSISGMARVDLITGSNMAGKSTFLRSIGVNMILAYAGGCVCANNFTVSVAKLMSSMRIEDDLAENTSTFYAELKKLKSIIDAVNRDEKVFILLDEILRGTNSLDRHAGSKALIRQLIKRKAIALIATHDIELSKLEQEFPQSIKNYHFDVQVNGEELFFDYKLKQGICQSMNASILMKKIGIDI